jgi:hypothetical protein
MQHIDHYHRNGALIVSFLLLLLMSIFNVEKKSFFADVADSNLTATERLHLPASPIN